jgi:hypothetical protein
MTGEGTPDHGAPFDPDKAERIAIAWEMYDQEGASYNAIGRRLGVSHVTAQSYVNQARMAEQTREARSKAAARHDLSDVVRELAGRTLGLLGEQPDPRDRVAVEQAITRMERLGPHLRWQLDMHARLHGLYAPTQTEVGLTQTTPAQNAISEALARRRQAREDRERREIEDARDRRNPPALDG